MGISSNKPHQLSDSIMNENSDCWWGFFVSKNKYYIKSHFSSVFLYTVLVWIVIHVRKRLMAISDLKNQSHLIPSYAAMNRGGDTFIFKPKLLIEGDFLILASKYDAFSSFYSFVLNLSLSLVFLCSTVRFFTAYPNAFICPMSTQIFFALVMAV